MTRSPHHESIIADCQKRIYSWTRDPWGMDYPSIPLTVAHMAVGEKTRLCGNRGPYCERIANVRDDHGTTGYWDARKVLKFLEGIT